MRLKVIGSGSTGNCYILDNGVEALAIECGMSFKKVMHAIDFNVSRLAGALLTHEHGDHAGHVREFMDRMVPVYASAGTARALKDTGRIRTICEGEREMIGSFTVLPFRTAHDAAEPFGFIIRHAETGNVMFLTDSGDPGIRFDGLNNIMIECNHSIERIAEGVSAGRIIPAVANRIVDNHLSLEKCTEILQDTDLTAVNNIVLLHLSESNSDAERMRDEMERATVKTVTVALPGTIIPFDKAPF